MKSKRRFLIVVVLLAAMFWSTGCVDDPQEEAYETIQNGQNAIKEAGDDVREASEEAGFNEEVDLEIDEKIEEVEAKVHQACLAACQFSFGPGQALESADNLGICLDQCGDK